MKNIVLTVSLATTLVSFASASEIRIFPETGGRNLRVPMILPVNGGAKGKCIPFEKVKFTYPIAPLLDSTDSGSLEVFFRDSPRRDEKTLLRLQSNSPYSIAFKALEPWKKRAFVLEFQKNGHTEKQIPISTLSEGKWEKISFRWNASRAELTLNGKNIVIPMPRPFALTKLEVDPWHIDELKLNHSKSDFQLDWERDYSAKITPGKNNQGMLAAQLHGFDSMVISKDPAKRDCPTMVFLNTTKQAQTVAVNFSVERELAGKMQSWKQTVTIPAMSSIQEQIHFPFELTTDVYHLKIESAPLFDTYKHFLFASRRNEPAGDSKFGLHDVNGNTFGFWPDALPITIAHKYLRWGYVQGPAWVKDRNDGKDYGIDPEAPAQEWAWNANLDWELLSGRTMFVCLHCTPWHDWQRERDYKNMYHHPWGRCGGMPDLKRAAQFVQAAANRYKGKIHLWEIENEPNTAHAFGGHPDDYAALARMVYSELKKVDSSNTVFGISGTSNFPVWMRPVFSAGGGQGMDAVSWHTYSNPTPDANGLTEMIREAKAVASDKKRFFNSETGHMCAMRETVTQALPKSYVDQKVAERAPGFVSRAAWPGRVYDEVSAASGMVRNAVINFREGVEGFIYFGWNLDWPGLKMSWKEKDPDFAIFSITPEKVRTPSLYTLSLGVLSTQMEGTLLQGIKPVEQLSLRGAIFPKKNNGKLAVVWPLIPMETILVSSDSPVLEIVDILGQGKISKTDRKNAKGFYLHSIKLQEQPIYLHVPAGKMVEFPPPPVEKVSVGPGSGEMMTVTLSLINTNEQAGRFVITSKTAGTVPNKKELFIPSKARASADFSVTAKAGETKRADFEITMPDGNNYLHPVNIVSRPRLVLKPLPENQKPDWKSLSENLTPLALNQVEQVVIGAPPKLASLQEKTFWGGRDELSAKILAGYNSKGIYIGIKAKDAVARPASQWPGIHGSVLELFFDFRKPGAGLGKNVYSRGTYQFLVQPGREPKIWSPQASKLNEKGISVFSSPLGKEYTCVIFLPWSFTGLTPTAGTAFGFDLGINAPWPDKNERKTQIMLFGTISNARDASGFGTAVIP